MVIFQFRAHRLELKQYAVLGSEHHYQESALTHTFSTMNNTQFITSRLYRPTPRSVVYAGLPLLFAVHPAFILATSGDEGLPVVISADVFKSADAKKSAVDNMYSTFGKALIASPLVVCTPSRVGRVDVRMASPDGVCVIGCVT